MNSDNLEPTRSKTSNSPDNDLKRETYFRAGISRFVVILLAVGPLLGAGLGFAAAMLTLRPGGAPQHEVACAPQTAPVLAPNITVGTRHRTAPIVGFGIFIADDASAAARGAKGVVVMDVPPGSSGERAGMNDGDVIRAVDGEPTTSVVDLLTILDRHALRDQVTVTVETAGVVRTLEATLQSVPGRARAPGYSPR